MQAADDRSQWVNRQIQAALANRQATELLIHADAFEAGGTPLTVVDAQRIMDCLRESPHRFYNLTILFLRLDDSAVLNVFRHGLALCKHVTQVHLGSTKLTDEGLMDLLLPVCYNTSVTSLDLRNNGIQGPRAGDFLRNVLRGNNSLLKLSLRGNRLGEGVLGLGQGLAGNDRLQTLNLCACGICCDGLARICSDGRASVLLAPGVGNKTLTNLDLSFNNIQFASVALYRFPQLKVLSLAHNFLGPVGARALEPGLAAAKHLESLVLRGCELGYDGVWNLVPEGRVNRSLTHLDLRSNGRDAIGSNVVALAALCPNLDHLQINDQFLGEENRRRLDLLLERRLLCTVAQALAGSTFSDLFQFVEAARRHDHGLSAIFLILRNDGDDHFYAAHKEEVKSRQQYWLLLAQVKQLQAEKQEQSALHDAAVAEWKRQVDKLKAERNTKPHDSARRKRK
jgi:Ran GTPase-activating protein (RanGAP) involved in mRNA processing and transport